MHPMRAPLIAMLVAVAASAPAPGSAEIDLIAPIDGPVIRHFEPPPTPYSAGHRGIDFGADPGSAVVASAGGVVAFAGPVGGTYAVSIDHAGGLRTTYSFLSGVAVKKGASVAQGTLIALSGNGHPGEGAPALHFGVRRGEEYLDPEPILIASMRANLHRVIYLAG